MYKILFTIISIIAIIASSVYAEETATTFILSTNAFLDQGALPVLYTCDGKDVSPQFEWAGLPAKTQSLVFIMSDAKTPSGIFYHWVLYNIPTSTTHLPQGTDKPTGSLIGKNSFGKLQYNGPCPPKGSAHSYEFTLYALDSKLTLPAEADAKTVLDTIQKHMLGKTQLTAVYSRWIR